MALSLDKDVDIIVDLSPRSIPTKAFNIGLLIGETSVISTTTRVVFYEDLTEMIDAGFTTDDPLYKGAVLYFNQDGNLGASIPGICIGAIGTTGSGSTLATEDLDDVILDCRAKSQDWYGFTTVDTMLDADIELLADTAESMTGTHYFAISTSTDTRDMVIGNIVDTLKTKGYRNTHVDYNEDELFSCGALGYAMGATTGLANSAYTMKFKKFTGCLPSDLTSAKVNAIEAKYGNVYVTRADSQYEQGTCCDGTYQDEMFNLDKLVNHAQIYVYDLLYATTKVPQTEAGQTQIANKIAQACEEMRTIGFIATGTWRKPTLLNINYGDTVPNGYLIQWQPVDEQSDADRDARKAQPFYVCLTLAGAVHSVVVQFNVSR